jgi:hypothetical protein
VCENSLRTSMGVKITTTDINAWDLSISTVFPVQNDTIDGVSTVRFSMSKQYYSSMILNIGFRYPISDICDTFRSLKKWNQIWGELKLKWCTDLGCIAPNLCRYSCFRSLKPKSITAVTSNYCASIYILHYQWPVFSILVQDYGGKVAQVQLLLCKINLIYNTLSFFQSRNPRIRP